MIEIIIRNYLVSALTEPVYLQRPASVPQRFVLIEKVGSGRNDGLPSSTFAIQSYAETLYEAAALNERVKATVDRLIKLDEIGGVALNSDYNYTDTTTKEFRYQAVYEIYHY
ncbi:MAG: hypothetical protein GX900_06515 [Clostridiaceae bacterium]|jgi:hypothetical protein|nr:hypothetical protein [Clostridiaceae bacterium]